MAAKIMASAGGIANVGRQQGGGHEIWMDGPSCGVRRGVGVSAGVVIQARRSTARASSTRRGVRWTIKDGIVYDAPALLESVARMVEEARTREAPAQ